MRIAYNLPSEQVVIIHAAPKETLERSLGKMTDAEYEAHVLGRSIPADAVEVARLPDDWAAPDRAQRDKWRLVGGAVVISAD